MSKAERVKALRVKDMTAIQYAAYQTMRKERQAWIASLAITPDTIESNLERDMVAAMTDLIMWADATTWYIRARRLSARIAEATGLTLDAIAGVIAVMSPNVPWSAQEKHTLTFVQQVLAGVSWKVAKGPGGYDDNREKAAKIVLGGDPHAICHGPKVYAFMLAILGDETQVVIDVWMARSSVNVDCDQDTAASIIGPAKVKGWIMQAVRNIAAKYGVTPAVAQAAMWLAAKERMEGARETAVSPVTFKWETYLAA